jgi:peroxiredoxin Q/BCP
MPKASESGSAESIDAVRLFVKNFPRVARAFRHRKTITARKIADPWLCGIPRLPSAGDKKLWRCGNGALNWRTAMKKRFLGVLLSVIALSGLLGADTPTPPAVGQTAPDFSLPSVEGGLVSLKDYKGKWVVLYFYPKDFTSGCTLEAHNFERDLTQYQSQNAVILGVSADTVQSHKDFCAKEGLNFKLLADPDLKAITKYGSAIENNGVKMAARNTFLIDPEGKIARVYLRVSPAGHSEQVLKDLAVLKKG